MSEKMTLVVCNRKECGFYAEHVEDRSRAWCTHPEKHHYLYTLPCPLFRLDFRRQVESTGSPKDFLKVLRRR